LLEENFHHFVPQMTFFLQQLLAMAKWKSQVNDKNIFPFLHNIYEYECTQDTFASWDEDFLLMNIFQYNNNNVNNDEDEENWKRKIITNMRMKIVVMKTMAANGRKLTKYSKYSFHSFFSRKKKRRNLHVLIYIWHHIFILWHKMKASNFLLLTHSILL
jgi:hypothetical protein